jgi:TPR repeat protein
VDQLKLAEQGDAVAQNTLGARLAQGYVVKKDIPGALYWYAQAVKKGYTHAKWNAGRMLLEGEGVPAVDVSLGMTLIEEAASCGDASACNFLAYCYERGVYGKTQDPTMSGKWSQNVKDHEYFLEYGSPCDIERQGIVLKKPTIEWL